VIAAVVGAVVLIGGAFLLLGGGGGGGGGSDGRTSGRVDVFTTQPGECFDSIEDDPDRVKLLPCDEPHDAEVFAVVDHPNEGFPGVTALDSFGANECGDRLVDIEDETGIELSAQWTYPTSAGWEDGERIVVCSAADPDGEKLESSVT
jgi:hypothetical protein